jgi:hypothetical protein
VAPTPKIPFAIRIRPEIKAALELAAKDDSRTLANMIEKIFSDWLRAKGYLPPLARAEPAAISWDELNASNDE